MMRNNIIALLVALVMAPSAFSFDNADADAAFAGRILDPIEGVWQFPDDGAMLMITRATATTYDISVLDSPQIDVDPGTVVGSAVATAKANSYDAKFSNRAMGNSISKNTAVLTVTDGMLRFEEYSKGKKLVLWRWLPYFMRFTVKDNNTKPKGLTGARKIYPLDSSSQKPCL